MRLCRLLPVSEGFSALVPDHPSVGCTHYKPKKNKTAMFFLKKVKVFCVPADTSLKSEAKLTHLLDF